MPFVVKLLSACKTNCARSLESLPLGLNGIDVHCVEGALVSCCILCSLALTLLIGAAMRLDNLACMSNVLRTAVEPISSV